MVKHSVEPVAAVSQSLCGYMNEIKEKIASRDKEWDIYKKFTNPCEYIHSVVPNKKRAVSKYKPISRSYFKMIEMMAAFQLDSEATVSGDPSSFKPPAFASESFIRTGVKGGDDSDASKDDLGWKLCSSERKSQIKRSVSHNETFLVIQPLSGLSPESQMRIDDSTLFSIQAEPKDTTLQRSASFEYASSSSANGSKFRSRATIPTTSSAAAPIRTFHLAEGPGGFIEAICTKRQNPKDQYYGMTILVDETDDNVPAWNKTAGFLAQNPNVFIETGADGTGNILRVENFDWCVSKYGSTMDLVTADGGFDFSKNFNKQELSITQLLWGQICYAICMQKKGGNFVLKIFDIFYQPTIELLYILSGFYDEVNVCKLQTSRIGNSEKYVVCKGFRYDSNAEFLHTIRKSFVDVVNHATPARIIGSAAYIHHFLNRPVPIHFVKQIEDINAMFGQQQIENIHYTISLIDKHTKYDKTEQLTKQNIVKCVSWCIEHKIPYNNVSSTNVFVGGTEYSNLFV